MPSLDNQSDIACATKVTTLLNEAGAGDAQAAALLPLVYISSARSRAERCGRSNPTRRSRPTALVHEAYLRLVDTTRIQLWESRWHFFAAAAESMRRILVDNARSRGRIKHGGEMNRVDLHNLELTVNDPPDELIALDEALIQLGKEHPEKAQLVNLRYFGGLTHEEAAQALGVSISTADRHWAFARAWLYRHMAEESQSRS